MGTVKFQQTIAVYLKFRVGFSSSSATDIAAGLATERNRFGSNWQPFTVNSTFDINEDGNLTDRLNSTAGLIQTSSGGSTILRVAQGVSTSSLLAAPGQSGLIGRNTFRAPARVNFDLALSGSIELSESHQVVIRGETFNTMNAVQFGIPQRLLEAPAFGQETRTVSPARIIQLAIRFSF